MDRFPRTPRRGGADDPSVRLRHGVRARHRHSSAAPRPSTARGPLRWLVNVYVEFIRNTPFLIQLYFVFFALPHFGMRLGPNTAALLAMVDQPRRLCDRDRARRSRIGPGWADRGRTRARAKPLQIVRFIILFPALKAVYPALTSQFILVLLGSSIVSAIAAEELTAVANTINSQTFRSFEIYTHRHGHVRRDRLRFPGGVRLHLRLTFARRG